MPSQLIRVILSHALAAVGMGLPWPALVFVAEEHTRTGTQGAFVVGAVAALRMAPYVALSWWSGRLADRRERARIVRLSLLARTGLLLAATAALALDHWVLAVVLCTGVVVAGTPAYPALAAGLPGLADAPAEGAARRATSLLVTVEVAAFVVGPALGGLCLDRIPLPAVAAAAALLVGLGWACFRGTELPAPKAGAVTAPGRGVWRFLKHNRSARHALVVVAGANAVVAALGLAVLELADVVWRTGPTGFGIATAALGFGALGAPVLTTLPPLRTARGSLLVLSGSVAGFAWAPPGLLAYAALTLVGAIAVCCEGVATGVLQQAVPDSLRATVLGLGDSVMVAAAALAALVTPLVTEGLGPLPVITALAIGVALMGLGQLPEQQRPDGGAHEALG